MNMTENFRREAREFLAYSRLWLRNLKTLSLWVFTWDKENPWVSRALRGTNYPLPLPKLEMVTLSGSQTLALASYLSLLPILALPEPPEARPHLFLAYYSNCFLGISFSSPPPAADERKTSKMQIQPKVKWTWHVRDMMEETGLTRVKDSSCRPVGNKLES